MGRGLFITNDFPPMTGGEATWYAQICALLPPEQVIVLAPRMPGDRSFDTRRRYRIIRRYVPVSPHPLARLCQLVLLFVHAAGLVRRERIDVVHIGHLYLGPVALALQRLAGVPYVLYLHGGEVAPYLRFRLVRWTARAIVQGARLVVANSVDTRRRYEATGVSHPNVRIVPPIADIGRFRPDHPASWVRRRYRVDGAKVLLTVGRLVGRKGHDAVIRALSRVQQAAGPVRYLIAGSGPEEPRLRALARSLGVADAVIFAGRVPDEDLPHFYAACDVFVMPSRELPERDGVEGFGIVFLEAGAAGKPVIGGRSGGIADAVLDGTTGLLVDPRSEDELATALISLLRDAAEAARLGQEGRSRAVQLTAAAGAALRQAWEDAAGDPGGQVCGA